MKGKSLLRKIGIGLPLLGVTLYAISPKIKFVQHKYQQEIADIFGKTKGLDSTYKHGNKETTTILNTLSGVVNKEELKKLLLEYGYTENEIVIDSTIKPDIALYKTLWEMNVKYGNPRSTFAGNYKNRETGNQEDKRAHFSPNNAIHLHNIKDLKVSFTSMLGDNLMEWDGYYNNEQKIEMGFDSLNKKLGENRQAFLINNWIAEIAHAKQYQIDGPIRMGMHSALDYLRSGFDYEDTYDMKRTVENEAHAKFEPALCLEFIETYKSHANMDDANSLLFVGLLYGGYFEHYLNPTESNKYLTLAANFILGKKEYSVWRKNQIQVDNYGDLTSTDSKILRDLSERQAIEHFSKCIQLGDKHYSQKLLSKIAEVRERYVEAIDYYKQYILFFESIKNPTEDQLYELAKSYNHLSVIYTKAAYIPFSKREKGGNMYIDKFVTLSQEFYKKGFELAGSIGRYINTSHHGPDTDY